MSAPAPPYARGRFRAPATAKPAKSATGGGASPYQLGKRFERASRGRLERRGFFVMRAGLSKGHKVILPDGTEAHSKLDLIAVKATTILIPAAAVTEGIKYAHEVPAHLVYGVQCKRRGDIGSTEWNELIDVCEPFGIIPVVAVKTGERTTGFFRLDERRIPRKPGRPWTAIDIATGEPEPEQLALA